MTYEVYAGHTGVPETDILGLLINNGGRPRSQDW